MKKINAGKLPFIYPMPMAIAGAIVNGKPNFMAVAWVTPVNYDPPMIGIALGKNHHTNAGIREHRSFSLCIPDVDLVRQTDYVGIVSGKDTDKSGVFNVFFQDREDIPMIAECPVCIQLKLEQVVELPSNEFFIGLVVATYIDERCIRDGKPDLRRISPFTLSMPDNNYWEVGSFLGKAWSVGKDFGKRISSIEKPVPKPVKKTGKPSVAKPAAGKPAAKPISGNKKKNQGPAGAKGKK